ncbi:MAG: DUF2752 domain-containing protein [Proteobacteria bacterium]|nr:MAG: DUF2752 domain-containing protein [Pseudomonadota bacterium]
MNFELTLPSFEQALSWAQRIPLRCPLYMLTGLQCPLCGLGRSLLATWLGEWTRAWHFHPLGPLLSVGGGIALSLYLLNPNLFRRLRKSLFNAWLDLGIKWKYGLLGIYFTVFVLRNTL